MQINGQSQNSQDFLWDYVRRILISPVFCIPEMEAQHYIGERVKFNTEIIKFLGLIFLATISGVVTLIYQ